MIKKYLLFSVFAMLCFCMGAQKPIEEFTQALPMRSASVGVLIINSTKGDTVVAYNQHKSLMPASLMKLITTSTALETLEPNFKFGTKLYVNSRPGADGTLYGNLIIMASGDPTIGSHYFGITPEMVFGAFEQTLVQNNIKRIAGAIETNVSLFDTRVIPPGWIWEDMGNYYAPGTYSMAWRDNLYKIHMKSDAPGTKVKILKTDPVVPGLELKNFVTAAANNKDSAYVFGAPFAYNQFVSGTIPAFKKDFSIKASLPDPAKQFNYELVNYLRKKGFAVDTAYVSTSPLTENSKLIRAIFSPPLHEIVKVANKKSVNLYAEYLLKHLSLKTSHVANREASIKMVYDYWRKKQLNVSNIVVQDGSGLSPKNLVTANFMVSMLNYMRNKSYYAEYFLESLPVSGDEGTLKNFLKDTNLKGRVYAKTGSMTGVRCYAGYVHAPSNEIYTFCILVNHFKGESADVVDLVEKLILNVVK